MIFKNYNIITKIFKGKTPIVLVKKLQETVFTVYQMIYKYITEFPYTFTSSGDDIEHFILWGNTIQKGTPTLTNTVEAVSVAGEKTSNLFDINAIVPTDNVEVNLAENSFDIVNNYAVSIGVTVPEILRMTGAKVGDKITVVAEIESITGSGGSWGSITILTRDSAKAQSINALPFNWCVMFSEPLENIASSN